MSSNPLELAEVIKVLRESLELAQTQGDGKNIRFNVTNIDVELQTVVDKEGGADGKVKFLVVDAGLSGKYKRSSLHKIKLSLQAVDMTKTNPDGTTGGTLDLSNTVTR